MMDHDRILRASYSHDDPDGASMPIPGLPVKVQAYLTRIQSRKVSFPRITPF